MENFIGEPVQHIFKLESPLGGRGSTFPSLLSLRLEFKKEGGWAHFPACLAQGFRAGVELELEEVTSFGHAQCDGEYCQLDIIYRHLGTKALSMSVMGFSDWAN